MPRLRTETQERVVDILADIMQGETDAARDKVAAFDYATAMMVYYHAETLVGFLVRRVQAIERTPFKKEEASDAGTESG